jgi:hypothetical protein
MGLLVFTACGDERTRRIPNAFLGAIALLGLVPNSSRLGSGPQLTSAAVMEIKTNIGSAERTGRDHRAPSARGRSTARSSRDLREGK